MHITEFGRAILHHPHRSNLPTRLVYLNFVNPQICPPESRPTLSARPNLNPPRQQRSGVSHRALAQPILIPLHTLVYHHRSSHRVKILNMRVFALLTRRLVKRAISSFPHWIRRLISTRQPMIHPSKTRVMSMKNPLLIHLLYHPPTSPSPPPLAPHPRLRRVINVVCPHPTIQRCSVTSSVARRMHSGVISDKPIGSVRLQARLKARITM